MIAWLMADYAQLIAYLHDCHQADSREQALWDMLSDKVRLRRVVKGQDEILDGTLGRLPVDAEWGEAARKMAQVYKRERSLIYAVFPILGGRIEQMGRKRTLCAPLLWFPLRLEVDQVVGEPMHFAVPDLDEPRFNLPVIRALLDQAQLPADSLDAFLADFPTPPWDAEALAGIAQGLVACLPHLEEEGMLAFPRLLPEKALKDRYKAGGRGKPAWACVPAAILGFVDNAPETRGVLFELESLQSQKPSGALRAILEGCRDVEDQGDLTDLPEVPALLSKPQLGALASARRQTLTLVIGPPGTGKSFTSAALALDQVGQGGSVLFASRSPQALDVIADKIEDMLGTPGCVLRGGRRKQLSLMRSFIDDLLRGQIPLAQVSAEELDRLSLRMQGLNLGVARIEAELEKRFRRELKLGRLLDRDQLSWATRLGAPMRCHWLSWRLGKAERAWAVMDDYQRQLAERSRVQALLLRGRLRRRLDEALDQHRSELTSFAKALRARSSSAQERYFEQVDLKVLLKTFPVWLVGLAGLHRILPLESELFDLVVMDEATQCDMASALPALQRAKKAVICGDPKQLRHVSFLARRRQVLCAEQHDLDEIQRGSFDYRERSLLDRVEDAVVARSQVVALDEHFRSRPSIIAFSNKRFYGNLLKVMTQVPDRDESGALELRRVAGKKVRAGANVVEAEAALALLGDWVEEQRERPAELASSFGLLSPFRDQVDLLAKLCTERLGAAAMERHDLLIGTAYSFQGEERDRMILSFAVDAESSAGAVRYLNRPDVFNVSITRARDRQVILASLDSKDAPSGSLLQQYLQLAGEGPVTQKVQGKHELADAFAAEVTKALSAEGLTINPAFPLAGLELDLVVTKNGQALGLDLVGHPGRFAPAFPLERYRTLLRAGLSVLPLTYSAWIRDRQGCVQAILAALHCR
ncbi:MAG: hypothetical protein JRF33_08045 [Deltaproteobacteria bacterium]|nr:hypothetical protein [Deltaproteobacteria bacterium]